MRNRPKVEDCTALRTRYNEVSGAVAAIQQRLPGCRHVSELHSFRQYQGAKAGYEEGAGRFEIQAYVHHVSDFLHAARAAGLALADLRELWRLEDENKPPRLITLLFTKA